MSIILALCNEDDVIMYGDIIFIEINMKEMSFNVKSLEIMGRI